MSEFHFVEDYERLVEQLLAAHPLYEAMSLAVGGQYEQRSFHIHRERRPIRMFRRFKRNFDATVAEVSEIVED